MKQSRVTLLGLASLALVASGSAYAGYKNVYPVGVGTSNFYGAIGSARNSTDTVQYIGCRDHGTAAYCYARNAAGTMKSCSTTNPTHLAMIRGWSDSVYVSINFSTSGTCTSMFQSKFSQVEPKKP